MKRLDLHGIRHQEVDRMVENFVLVNQNDIPLMIICGNSQQMIKLVKTVTERLKVETFSPYYGTFIIIKL